MFSIIKNVQNRTLAGLALAAAAGLPGVAGAQVWETINRPNIVPVTDSQAWANTLTTNGFGTIAGTIRNGRRAMVLTRYNGGGLVIWERLLFRTAEENGFVVDFTNDGGFLIAGETTSPGGNFAKTTLIKTNGAGAFQWARIFDGGRFDDRPVSVGMRELRIGGSILVHRTITTVGTQLASAALTTPAGVVSWSRGYWDPRFQAASKMAFADVREIPSAAGGIAGFIAVGYTTNPQTQNKQIIAMRLDAAGNPIIFKAYNISSATESSYATGLVQTTNGWRIVGRITDPQLGPNIVDDTFVLDVDAALNVGPDAGIYDNFKVNRGSIEAGVANPNLMVGSLQITGQTAQAMTVGNTAAAWVPAWMRTYGRQRNEDFRGVQAVGNSIVASGFSDSFGNGEKWIYNVRTDALGRNGCENTPQIPIIRITPRNVDLQTPFFTVPEQQWGLESIQTPFLQKKPCNPIPADFNHDGFLDGFDYDEFVKCFEGTFCEEGNTADFNFDEFLDGFDYDEFVRAFEN